MFEFFESSGYIAWHRDVDVPFIIVPVKGEAPAVLFSGPVDCEVIVGFLDGIDEMHGGVRYRGKYFMSKSSRASVVRFMQWHQRPGVKGMGSYPEGANFWTSWLKVRMPASLRPYIPRRISR